MPSALVVGSCNNPFHQFRCSHVSAHVIETQLEHMCIKHTHNILYIYVYLCIYMYISDYFGGFIPIFVGLVQIKTFEKNKLFHRGEIIDVVLVGTKYLLFFVTPVRIVLTNYLKKKQPHSHQRSFVSFWG